MKVAIACDHGALQLKEALIPFIKSLGHSVRDFGTHSPNSCDYPDYAAAAAEAVAEGSCDKGIVLCTTGIGVSITANKVHGIRCALLSDVNSARMTRLHNDTNMMALGAAVVSQDLAFSIVETWLSTPFSNEDRHQRRIDKMMDLERNQKKKQRNEYRRRRNTNPIVKAVNFALCLLLIFSLSLIPVANFITNLADPAALVEALLDSDLLSGLSGSTETPEVTDPTDGADVPEDTGSDEGASSSSSGTGETDTAAEDIASSLDINSLLSGMGSLADTGILDMDSLLGELELSDTDLDVDKLSADIMKSDAAKEILSAYVDDVMNAAMSENPEEYQSTLTGDFVKKIITNNIDNIIDIVESNLSEEAQANFNRDDLKTAVSNAVDQISVEDLNAALDAIKPTDAVASLQADPTVGPVLKILKFIHTGALRAVVLLVVIALALVIALFRFPGMRGLTSIGISGVVAAMGCGATYLVLRMPLLTQILGSGLGAIGGVLLPVIGDLAWAFRTCAIVYAVLGAALVVCTTLLRGFFGRIFDAIFSQD